MKLTPKQQKTFNPYNLNTLEDLQNLPDDYHAVLAPSSMGRVMKCPASVQESLEAPVKPTSEAAIRGTKLHEILAEVLEDYFNGVTEGEGRLKNLEAKDREQILFCVDYVEEMLNGIKQRGEQMVSIKLEVGGSLVLYGMAFIHGTADLKIETINLDGKTIVYIRDWKFGFVEVFTVTSGVVNAQLHVYGIAHLTDKVDFLDLGIVQPEHYYTESVRVSREHSIKWLVEYFRPVIVESMGPKARFNPGKEQCRFCPCYMTCRVRKNHMDKLIKEARNLTVRLPHVTVEELVARFNEVKEIKQYISQIEKHLLAMALDGDIIPEMKVVHGRGTRYYDDPVVVEKYLLMNGITDEQLYKSKMISPAQAEKINRKLKKSDSWKALIELKEGKPQLVPVDDKREGITPGSQATRAFHEHIES